MKTFDDFLIFLLVAVLFFGTVFTCLSISTNERIKAPSYSFFRCPKGYRSVFINQKETKCVHCLFGGDTITIKHR